MPIHRDNLAVQGEHAGVVEYPRATLFRAASLSWLFLIGSLPGFAAMFLRFSTDSEALSYHTPLTYLVILEQDYSVTWWMQEMLALSFFSLIPLMVWRRRARGASASAATLHAGEAVSWFCLVVLLAWFGLSVLQDCDQLMRRASRGPMPLPPNAAEVPMGVRIVWSVVTWIIVASFMSTGLWIARRARARGAIAAAIMARLATSYLIPVGFALFLVATRNRTFGWYLTVPTVSIVVGEMVLIAVGQWPPRVRFKQRISEDTGIALTPN
jgi:hypothetical protein